MFSPFGPFPVSFRSSPRSQRRVRRRYTPALEELENREVPVVNVTDAPAFAISITGADSVTVTCDTATTRVAVSVNGAAPTVYTTSCSAVTSLSVTATGVFDNLIDLSKVQATQFSALTSVSVDAGAGNDVVLGSGVADTINGNDGNDRLVGDQGNDIINGGIGDDTIVWNNGDNSDTIDGGAGNNTVEVNGAASADDFQLGGSGTTFTVSRLNLVPFTLSISNTQTLNLNGLDGDDTFRLSNLTGITNLKTINVNGGAGSDTVVGPNLVTTWTLIGANAGTVASTSGFAGTTSFSSVENLTGGSSDDLFQLSNGAGMSGRIDGGAGNNTIDYSAYTIPVAVNLQAGTATNVIGGIANIQRFVAANVLGHNPTFAQFQQLQLFVAQQFSAYQQQFQAETERFLAYVQAHYAGKRLQQYLRLLHFRQTFANITFTSYKLHLLVDLYANGRIDTTTYTFRPFL
jgi:hypothetical protein